jgi:hypothetical protein
MVQYKMQPQYIRRIKNRFHVRVIWRELSEKRSTTVGSQIIPADLMEKVRVLFAVTGSETETKFL